MNIHQHMEAIFVIVLVVIGLGSYLLDSLPDAQARPPHAIARDIATPTSMAVVIVSAPRAQGRK